MVLVLFTLSLLGDDAYVHTVADTFDQSSYTVTPGLVRGDVDIVPCREEHDLDRLGDITVVESSQLLLSFLSSAQPSISLSFLKVQSSEARSIFSLSVHFLYLKSTCTFGGGGAHVHLHRESKRKKGGGQIIGSR